VDKEFLKELVLYVEKNQKCLGGDDAYPEIFQISSFINTGFDVLFTC